MGFDPGRVALRRYWRAGRISFLNVMTVVADDARGLRLWQSVGAPFAVLTAADGRTQHDGAIDELGPMTLAEKAWVGSDVMVFHPAERPPWTVWWFFDEDHGGFQGWYVNLEEPIDRWDDGALVGVDTADHALDIWVEPDRSWRWKDEGEFAAKIGHPLYWNESEAAKIRAAGCAAIDLVEAGKFPFDGSWCDLAGGPPRPVPTRRPDGWDRPRA